VRDDVIESNQAAAERFKRAGAKVQVQPYDGGHVYPDDSDEALAKALRFVLGA
jgi:predicted esterase